MSAWNKGETKIFTKRVVLAGLFLLLTLPALAEGTGPLPRLVIYEPVFEGKFRPGTAFEHEFTLFNKGKAPLLVEVVRTGCSCTATAYDQSIPPGGQSRVRLALDVHAEWAGRDIRRTVWLMTNDPEAGQVSLVVRGRVAGP